MVTLILATSIDRGDTVLEAYRQQHPRVGVGSSLVLTASTEQLALLGYSGWSDGVMQRVISACVQGKTDPLRHATIILSEHVSHPGPGYWIWRDTEKLYKSQLHVFEDNSHGDS